jgi:hypothetical protein
MQQGIPTEETVLQYFSTLSNWGRWGTEDQLGKALFYYENRIIESFVTIHS